MMPATACRLAGPGARLVARPRGVVHVYRGPLTPSGEYVPSRRRTVCRAHTRQLRVVTVIDDRRWGERVCARCSACLSGIGRRAGHPVSRGDWRAATTGVARGQLALEAYTAADVDTLDTVGHLSLLLFGHAGCNEPIPHPTLPDARPVTLHDLIGQRRRGLASPDGLSDIERQFRDLRLTAKEKRKANAIAIHDEREARKARLGIRIANP